MTDREGPMNASPSNDPTAEPVIAPPLERLIAVFRDELGGVRFPGADVALLEQAADRVRVAADELAQAEALLERARASLGEANEHLLQKGHRALAYARIYAEESPSLSLILDAIVLPRAGRLADAMTLDGNPPAPRRRGRPPKVTGATPLFSPRDADEEPTPTPAPMPVPALAPVAPSRQEDRPAQLRSS
jgi:multidrug efflux pump subunit AcrA (membrane-fusion protein)